MANPPISSSEPVLSKRRVGLAGAAALVGCVACCTLPLMAAAGIGGGVAASLSSLFQPGSELIVAPVVFLSALGLMVATSRLKKGATSSNASCEVDGGCCARGQAPPNT